MTKIGLLSDTHCFVHPKIYEFFKDCDEIWHAGDFGNLDVAYELSAFKPIKGVYGNIDGFDVRNEYPLNLIFDCEKVKVFMTHIGGYPYRYEPVAKLIIEKERPKLFISGHSHILKVVNDKKYKLLHMNPGAAGKYGFHNVITLLRFTINIEQIKDLEIMELKKH
jgi:hypothetical protein